MSEYGIQVFTNESLGQIRTIVQNDEPWFVAADICDILGIKNPTVAMKGLEDFERAKLNLGAPYGEVNIVSESGFYAMVIRSRKEAAKPFRIWVTSEVLPSIRKTGKYEISYEKELSDSDYKTEFLELNQKYDRLYEDMGKMAQLVIDMHDRMMSTETEKVQKSAIPNAGSMYEAWKSSIYERLDLLKQNKGFESKKAVLRHIYDRMTRDYGVCWSQEILDYKNKYNISSRIFNLDVIWDKEMLRSIFNGILGGLMQELPDKEEKEEPVPVPEVKKKKYGNCDAIIQPLIEKRNDTSNHGCATFKQVYMHMDKSGKINWHNMETRYINKYGTHGMTRKSVIEESPTLMKKFKESVNAMLVG